MDGKIIIASEILGLKVNEYLGASPHFITWTKEVSADSSFSDTIIIPDGKVWKIDRIEIDCEIDTFYLTIAIDSYLTGEIQSSSGIISGNLDVFPRQLIKEGNWSLEFPTPVLAYNKIYINAENTDTISSQTIYITFFITEYGKKELEGLWDKLQQIGEILW